MQVGFHFIDIFSQIDRNDGVCRWVDVQFKVINQIILHTQVYQIFNERDGGARGWMGWPTLLNVSLSKQTHYVSASHMARPLL